MRRLRSMTSRRCARCRVSVNSRKAGQNVSATTTCDLSLLLALHTPSLAEVLTSVTATQPLDLTLPVNTHLPAPPPEEPQQEHEQDPPSPLEQHPSLPHEEQLQGSPRVWARV